MTKTSFYTMVLKEGKKQAELIINGYSDNDGLYYYKAGSGWWSVIHPLCGLSVAQGRTRKEAQQAANTTRVKEGLQRIYSNKEYYKNICNEFEKAIQELKNRNRA